MKPKLHGNTSIADFHFCLCAMVLYTKAATQTAGSKKFILGSCGSIGAAIAPQTKTFESP